MKPLATFFPMLVCATLALPIPSALAQAWPTKPVRIVMPSPTAGSPDRVTRLIADKLAQRWGQAVLVENRPGATTVMPASVAAAASRAS